jgi:hypothetical protein
MLREVLRSFGGLGNPVHAAIDYRHRSLHVPEDISGPRDNLAKQKVAGGKVVEGSGAVDWQAPPPDFLEIVHLQGAVVPLRWNRGGFAAQGPFIRCGGPLSARGKQQRRGSLTCSELTLAERKANGRRIRGRYDEPRKESQFAKN